MKLIVKLPKDKPPFIGICHMYEFEGMKMNADLIEDFKNSLFKVVFEFQRAFCQIKLYSENDLIIRHYVNVSYDNKQKLKAWLELTKNAKAFNFGHIYKKNDVDTIIKTNKNVVFVLKVESYSTIEEEPLAAE